MISSLLLQLVHWMLMATAVPCRAFSPFPPANRGVKTTTGNVDSKQPISIVLPDAFPRRILTTNNDDEDNVLQRQFDGLASQHDYPSTMTAASARRNYFPPNASVSRTDAGTLILEFAPPGVDANSLFAGAFGLAWFSVILPATLSSASLFLLPFWGAGALVAKQAAVDPFVGKRLELGQYAWSLTTRYGSRNNSSFSLSLQEGPTDELHSACVLEQTRSNKDDKHEESLPQFRLQLLHRNNKLPVAIVTSDSRVELEFLAEEINQHLKDFRDMPDMIPPPP